MRLISDVKQVLRKINTLKINHTTFQGNAFQNLYSNTYLKPIFYSE